MSDEHSIFGFQRLESPLDGAVQAVLAEPLPEAAIERVRVRAKQLAEIEAAPAGRTGFFRGKRPARGIVIGGAIAAVVVLAVFIGSNLVLDGSGARAFAQAVANVKAARSVQFKLAERTGQSPEVEGRIFLEGNRLRVEQLQGSLVQIADIAQKRALFLNTRTRLVQQTEMNAHVAEQFANPIDQLRQAKSSDAESIGEENVDGQRARIYRLRKVALVGIKGEMLVWIDVKSGLPTKFVIHDSNPRRPSEIQFDDFVWNQPLQPALFSLDVPAGYQTGIVVLAPQRQRPSTIDKAALDAPNVSIDGIMSHDRVPCRIVWSADGAALTALMREPEAVRALERRPNELRQWDVATGKLRWAEELGGNNALAITADGKTIATVISEELQLRDSATGQIVKKWDCDLFPPQIAFSPDGNNLALAIADWKKAGAKGSGGVQIRRVAEGAVVRSIADDQPTTFVAYSRSGKFVATASNIGPVKLWDAATGELARMFGGTRAAFSPDGRTVACVLTQWNKGDKEGLGTVELYDLETASLVKSFVCEKPTLTSWLLTVGFAADGRLLAAPNWDGTVTLWDVATGQRKQTYTEKGGVHAAVFSPDGSVLATGSEDRLLRLRRIPAEANPIRAEKK